MMYGRELELECMHGRTYSVLSSATSGCGESKTRSGGPCHNNHNNTIGQLSLCNLSHFLSSP